MRESLCILREISRGTRDTCLRVGSRVERQTCAVPPRQAVQLLPSPSLLLRLLQSGCTRCASLRSHHLLSSFPSLFPSLSFSSLAHLCCLPAPSFPSLPHECVVCVCASP